MSAVVYLTLFVLGSLGVLLALGTNVLAPLLPSPERLRRRHLIAALAVLAIGSGTFAVLQYAATDSGSAPAASASPSPPAGPSSPVSPSAAANAPAVRQPSQWASEVEAVCKPMVPALTDDLEALKSVDKGKVQLGDEPEIAALAAALRGFHQHYALLARQIHDVEPPSYSTDAVNEWLRLFDQRGASLYAGIEKLDQDSFLGRTQGALAMYNYGTDTDRVLAKATQLGIESCP